jgi:DNA-binding GntR family transcriptional regulator
MAELSERRSWGTCRSTSTSFGSIHANMRATTSASRKEHWAVADALQTRDPQTAHRVMEDHIRSASRRIVELIDFDAQQVR